VALVAAIAAVAVPLLPVLLVAGLLWLVFRSRPTTTAIAR
jgi:hypothetical protein